MILHMTAYWQRNKHKLTYFEVIILGLAHQMDVKLERNRFLWIIDGGVDNVLTPSDN